MPGRESQAWSRARIGRWLLVLSAIGAAIALGGIHTPVLVIVTIGGAIATTLLYWDATPFIGRNAATLLVGTSLALLAWTALQLVPLPMGLLETIAPANAEVWAHSLTPLLQRGPSWAPLSLDPTATRVQVVRGLAYLVFFLGAAQVARQRDGISFLERALVVGVLIAATSAMLHPVLGAHKVFGIYEPKDKFAYEPTHIGPLLNVNHLAAYSNIGALLAFASVLRPRGAIPRPIAGVVALLLAATTVWTVSRGGTATLCMGLVVVIAVAFRGRTRLPRLSRVLAPAMALAGTALFLFFAFDKTRAKFLTNDLAKLGMARNALELLRSYTFFGTGRGSFESVFPSVRRGTEYLVYTHPENVFVQFTTEWGLPVGVGALAAILWALRPQSALIRSVAPAGAFAALVTVGLQNFVDFSSEIPGVMIALIICAAIVTGGTGVTDRRRLAQWAQRPRAVAIGVLVVAPLMALALMPFANDELYDEQTSFAAAALDESVSLPQFRLEARTVLLHHPAEPYFPYVGAVRASARRDDDVIPWAERTLGRSPVYGRLHVLLGRTFFGRNRSQARVEYRTACEQDAMLCGIREAIPLISNYDDAMELVPDGQRGARVLEQLGARLGSRLPSTVVRLDEDLTERDPLCVDPVRRRADGVVDDVRNDESWCNANARAACVADGLAAAAHLRASAPTRCDGHLLVAQLRVLAGDGDAAFVELEDALDHIDDHSRCVRRYVELVYESDDRSRLDSALDRLVRTPCDESECVENLLFAAQFEAQRKARGRALTLTRKALERAPEREDLMESVADQAAAQGLHAEALDAYQKLAARHPNEPRWKAAVDRERDGIRGRGIFDRPRSN